MCLIWQSVKKKTNLGICISHFKISLPQITSLIKINQQIKDPKKRLLHLFALYPTEYRIYEPLLGGLIDMIGALSYHHNNHTKIENKLIKHYMPLFEITFSDPEHNDPEHESKYITALNAQPNINLEDLYNKASYEASAYLNRIGQLKALFDSDWFKQYLSMDETKQKAPMLNTLIYLRHKVTAHRRVDDPHAEDIGNLSSGRNHFRLQPAIIGNLANKEAALNYQLISKAIEKGYVDFIPKNDHLIIIEEILNMVETFLKNVKT